MIPETTTIYLERKPSYLCSLQFFNIKKQKWDVLQEKITCTIFFHDYLSEDFFLVLLFIWFLFRKKNSLYPNPTKSIFPIYFRTDAFIFSIYLFLVSIFSENFVDIQYRILVWKNLHSYLQYLKERINKCKKLHFLIIFFFFCRW